MGAGVRVRPRIASRPRTEVRGYARSSLRDADPRPLRILTAFLGLLVALGVLADTTPSPDAGRSGGAALVVITGLGGEPAFDERFHAWAATLMDAARKGGNPAGVPSAPLRGDSIVYLAGDPGRDPRARGRSSRDNVQATLAELAASLPPEAPLFLVVIGHGSHRDGVSKVNLPGPDMTAQDFAAALEPFGERRIVFANLTSASGEMMRELSAPGRVVITATRSATERNATVFARYFAAAFVGDAADADHDGRLSVLEAFDYARGEVERAYGREQKLQTEHPLLDDNGDGVGSAHPGIDAEDGRLAAILTLAGTATAPPAPAGDPELARLYRQKAELEQAVADLRRRKAELAREDYENRLEEILIQLALAHRAIRNREDDVEDGR